VVLVAHPDGHADWVSKMIEKVTMSPYSHCAVALDGDSLADANPMGGGPNDVRTYGTTKDALLKNIGVARLVVLRSKSVADPARMARKVDQLRALPDLRFSDGAATGVAFLQLLERVPPPLRHAKYRRLRNALVATMNDGQAQLFCSEFAVRLLRAGHNEPVRPANPTVDLDDFPVEDPPQRGITLVASGFLDRAWDWFLNKLDLNRETLETVSQKWSEVVTAYETHKSPDAVDLANFWTPADLAASSSFTTVAHRDPDDVDWVVTGG
jgi:hypothetical protein